MQMNTQKHCVAILLTTVMIEQTCQSSLAFNIKGQTTSQAVSLQVAIPNSNINGTVTVTTKDINEIQLGGTEDFLNVLRQSYPLSTFQNGDNLNGGFNVQTYYPCSPLTGCGTEIPQNYPQLGLPIPSGGKTTGVGSSISVDYEPNSQDDPTIDRVTWIQRAKINTGGQTIQAGSLIGTSFDIIDTIFRDNPDQTFRLLPTYPGYEIGRINPITGLLSYSFFDVAYNPTQNPQPSYLYNNDWSFELYLVEFTGLDEGNSSAPKYKIYNGISWGWTSKFTPCEPSSGGGGCEPGISTQALSGNVDPKDNSTANLAINNGHNLTLKDIDLASISGDLLVDPELASANGNSLAPKTKKPDDDALPAEAVPEPTTGLGAFLALGGLGLLKKLKNRKTKE